MHREGSVNSDPLVETVVILEDCRSMHANESASKLAERLGVPMHVVPLAKKHPFKQGKWHLVFTEKGLVLRVADEPSWSDIIIDFNSATLSYRSIKGGGKNEAIAKAIGIKSKRFLHVLDCTAGMGTDSFVMASVGAKVTMLERSPIIAALLEDAVARATQMNLEVAQNLTLIQQDAITYLSDNQNLGSKEDGYNVVYLDPMFPHKKKSALVKKEMQAFQLLLGPDVDSKELFTQAINFAPNRIVIKRPSIAPELENEQGLCPTTSIQSKKHRFDVYLLNP